MQTSGAGEVLALDFLVLGCRYVKQRRPGTHKNTGLGGSLDRCECGNKKKNTCASQELNLSPHLFYGFGYRVSTRTQETACLRVLAQKST